MASASGQRDAGEAPAKKPWSRPTFYVLTDVIESHGAPGNKTHSWEHGLPISEDETAPGPSNAANKNYAPASV